MNKLENLCNEYRENKRLIEELQAMNDELKNNILSEIGDQETVIAGANKISNKLVNGTRFDSTAFKKVYPDLFKEYNKITSYKRFVIA